MAVIIWIIIALAAGVVEMGTTALVSVWFAVGAVCAAIAAGLGFSESFAIMATHKIQMPTGLSDALVLLQRRLTQSVPKVRSMSAVRYGLFR